MKKSKKKLGIEKFRVAKLTNAFRVIGGSEDQPDGDITQTEDKLNTSTVQCLTTNTQ